MKRTVLLFAAVILCSLVMAGCVTTVSKERSVKTYNLERGAADKALAEARERGDDAKCPARYNASAWKRNEAVDVFWSCRTAEAIKMMRQARQMADALCEEPQQGEEMTGAAEEDELACETEPASSGRKAAKQESRKEKTARPAPPKKQAKPAPAKTKPVEPAPTRADAARQAAAVIEAISEGEGGTESQAIGQIKFDFDRADIRIDFHPALDGVAAVLKDHPDVRVVIHGHADATGTEAYNQGLSERRAEAVKEYLQGKGVKGSRLSTVGHGELDPVATNDTEAGRAKNRRAEVKAGE